MNTTSQWITRPVADLPASLKNGYVDSFNGTFRALDPFVALFIPFKADGSDSRTAQAAAGNKGRQALQGKGRVHTRVDRDAGGVWVWWEPKA